MSVIVLYRIVNAIGDGWMLPPDKWYHGHQAAFECVGRCEGVHPARV